MSRADIYSTRPFLPPLEELTPYLEQIWENRILTNSGPFHQQFEREMGAYLDLDHVSMFSNGTLGLGTAIQAMALEGEVITTPYSFVATTHCLLWNNLEPVFVDVDPVSLNIDPAKIEAAITPRTSAILAVHCYGTPCDVHAIKAIADRHGLKVVYDAAHAFGVRYDGESLLKHGDVSVLSLHATKAFNTFEGGAVIAPDEVIKARIDSLRNYGKVGELDVVAIGTNGKMSEFNAALGLLQLKYIDDAIRRRGLVDEAYRERLGNVRGIKLLAQDPRATLNHCYFPIFVTGDYPLSRDALDQRLRAEGIFGRPYFYPLISDFPMYRSYPSADPAGLPIAAEAARQVFCLPIYPELPGEEVERIADIVAR
jgi:dTDP-4-amino-4,6-dideoxygalactose transaminase